ATILVERINAGWEKSRERDHERAEQLLLEALERAPDNSRLHWAMGVLRRHQKRFNEAKVELEKTIELEHNNASGMLQLGFTLVVLGQPEAALPYFEKAIQLNPRNKNIHFYYLGLGQCHMFLGHLDKAVELLRKSQASNPAYFYIPVILAATLGL